VSVSVLDSSIVIHLILCLPALPLALPLCVFSVGVNGPVDRILVIEDDPTVQRPLKHVFESAGLAVDLADDGVSGLKSFRTSRPSVVVLDLCLPGRSGKEVCREIKQQLPSIPIIVLSAVTDVSDKVVLFELGADDYVTKPFSPRELLARVEAAVRRSKRLPGETDAFAFADIAVNFSAMEVTRAGQLIALTPQEFKLLRFLVRNRDRVVKRDEMLQEVWGYEAYPSTRTVDNHLLRLRQKLEHDPTEPLHFHTVHAVGYKFTP